MQRDLLHENLCAYLFDEVDADTAREIEAALAADPELRAERERLLATRVLLQRSLAGTSALSERAHADLAAAASARRGEIVPLAPPWGGASVRGTQLQAATRKRWTLVPAAAVLLLSVGGVYTVGKLAQGFGEAFERGLTTASARDAESGAADAAAAPESSPDSLIAGLGYLSAGERAEPAAPEGNAHDLQAQAEVELPHEPELGLGATRAAEEAAQVELGRIASLRLEGALDQRLQPKPLVGVNDEIEATASGGYPFKPNLLQPGDPFGVSDTPAVPGATTGSPASVPSLVTPAGPPSVDFLAFEKYAEVGVAGAESGPPSVVYKVELGHEVERSGEEHISVLQLDSAPEASGVNAPLQGESSDQGSLEDLTKALVEPSIHAGVGDDKSWALGLDRARDGFGQRAAGKRPLDADDLIERCRPRPNERPRDMYFRFWGDNAFLLTSRDALATFAADVDTASYVLARKYLVDGHLPEKAQIRSEEFVNYFTPDLAPPEAGVFAVTTELAPSPFGGSDARWLLRVGLRGKQVPREEREPLALTFIVDTSGSMKEGQRLELVKHALRMLVAQLDARDQIGIIAFSNEARLVLPMTRADQKTVIEAALQPLSPNGSTNAEAGLKLGYELAATVLSPESHNRVVFLSDGVANVGETDQARISGDIAERRRAGIYLNTIGVGMNNHNDVFLEQLANKGDGVCDYVDDAAAVHRAIVERFTGAFQPIASDVKIQVEFDDGQVLRWRQLGYENRVVADADFRNDAVDAGEVGSGHQITALFELERAGGQTPEAAPIAKVRVRWKAPKRAGDDPREPDVTEVEVLTGAGDAVAAFDSASPGFQRAALAAQFAEVLRRSSHAQGDSYERLIFELARVVDLPAFTGQAENVELLALVRRAEMLGIGREIQRSDLDLALEEYKRHQFLVAQLDQLERSEIDEELRAMRLQNERLERRIRELCLHPESTRR